ncbi:MAG: division/cell wall cluster transcriptional repressor MraZ [Sporocytophaga sp.]|jgi:MraZ protein|nr:division/cell wall cluster transcriptional repressor MraZ [Sporocytophaga sp.]
MSYFSSEYDCKMDAKGRLVLPARIKANLPEASENSIVITRGFEPCLVVYPMNEWKKVFSKVSGLNEFNEEYRNFQRNFFRGNSEVELDNNGRFLIPKPLLRHAQIDKDVIVVGLGNRIELWNPELYEKFLIKDQQEFAKLAEKYLGNEPDQADKK